MSLSVKTARGRIVEKRVTPSMQRELPVQGESAADVLASDEIRTNATGTGTASLTVTHNHNHFLSDPDLSPS